jgi:hypothetical protein
MTNKQFISLPKSWDEMTESEKLQFLNETLPNGSDYVPPQKQYITIPWWLIASVLFLCLLSA